MKTIDYQVVDITEDEWGYYKELTKIIDPEDFRNLFKTDQRGLIISIAPTKPVAWLAIFFVQQVMINQHIRVQDRRIEELEKRIACLQK